MGCLGSKANTAQSAAQPAIGTLLVDKSAQAETDTQKPVPVGTIEIRIQKKADNDLIGLEGAAYEDCWEVSSVGEGLVKRWNEQNPELLVEVGDKIVACNDVRGNGKAISVAMNEGMDWQIIIAKAKAKNALPENSTPHENHEVASASVDTAPEPIRAPLDSVPETSVQGTPGSGVQETVEEDTADAHGETDLNDSPTLNEPDQAQKQEVTAIIEEQPLAVDHVEPKRQQEWSTCCF